MKHWKEGDFDALVSEGRTLQQRLPKYKRPRSDDPRLARSFANLMFEGKTKFALQILCNQGTHDVLLPNDTVPSTNDDSLTVLEVLKSKHTPSQPAPANALPQGMAEPVDIHPVVFETLDAAKIRSAALRTSGAAGPSGLDAKEWERLCTSFKHASKDLCHSLALMARCLSTTYVDPRGLSPYKITTPLKTLIRGKDPTYPFETWEEQYKAKDEVHKSRRKKLQTK